MKSHWMPTKNSCLGITAPVATPSVVPPAPPTSADFASVDGFQQYKDWSHAGQAASTFTNIAAGFNRVEGSKGSDVMTGGASLGSSATSPASFNATQIVGRAGDDRLFAVAEQTEAQALAGTPLLAAQEAPAARWWPGQRLHPRQQCRRPCVAARSTTNCTAASAPTC